MTRSRRIAVALASLTVGAGLGYAVHSARAAGIPATKALSYSGVLEGASGPVSGSHDIQVTLYDAATAGNQLCQAPSTPVPIADGHFSVQLPDACAASVGANPNVWVDVFVDGADTGRTPIGAVPYAVEANHATSATTASAVVTAAWQAVPVTAGAPVAAWSDGRFGTGLQYSNVGAYTCLRGLIEPSQAGYTDVFATLPAGSRPNIFMIFVAAGSAGDTHIQITSSGEISFRDVSVPASAWVSLAGICFSNAP